MTTKFTVVSLALLLLSASFVTAQGKPLEDRLDTPLKLLYRSQLPAGKEARSAAPDRAHALEIFERLRPERLRARKRAGLAAGAESIRLPLLVEYTGNEARLEEAGFQRQATVGDIHTGTLDSDRLGDLLQLPGLRFIQLSQEIRTAHVPVTGPFATDRKSAPSSWQGSPHKSLTGAGAIVAFIDTGVDIFHHDFRHPDGTTRIRFLLDFSNPGDVNDDGVLDGLGPFGGTLYSEADLNAALAAGLFTEADTTGHGSHGLSIAAGDDATSPGLAPESDLIVVKATREGGSMGFWSVDIINALAFIDDKAGELGQPYVANLSLGTIFSSHDGRSLEEQAVDSLVGPGVAGKAVVLAAGNSSDNAGSAFHHVTGTADAGLDSSHTLTVDPYTENPGKGNDRIILDLWYEGNDRLGITVTAPDGFTEVSVAYGQFTDVATAFGDVFIANLGGAYPANGDTEAIVLIDDWSGTPPAVGEWTLTLTGEEIGESGIYHGWLADDSVLGSSAPYFSANADNSYLVGKPGCAYHGITVGSFARHDPGSRFLTSWTDVNGLPRSDTSAVDEELSNFSSPGPTRDGRIKPEMTAPGERVMGAVSKDAYPGVSSTSIYQYHPWPEADALIVDDTADHAFGMLQGTSFSAPVVTGLAARILSTDPTLDAIQVRNVLINSASTDGSTGSVPSDGWGYGRADLGVGGPPLPSDLRITRDALPDGIVGVPYGEILTASGGATPYSWELTSGPPPPGLELDASLIGGTPTTPGSYPITVDVTDESLPAATASKDYDLAIVATPALDITTRNLPRARILRAYDEPLRATGGSPPYTFFHVAGDMPPGLLLSSDRIEGTPIALGRYDFTIEVEDSTTATAMRSLVIRVGLAIGAFWEPLGIITTEVNRIAIDLNDPSRLLCSTENAFDDSQDVVYESTDRGESWRPVSINNGFNDTADFLTVNPASSVPWGIRAAFQAVLRFDDATSTWIDTEVCGLGTSAASAIDFDPSGDVYVTGNFCAVDGSLRRSQNEGASWSTVGTLCGAGIGDFGPPYPSLSISPTDPSIMYATRNGLADTTSTSVTCRSVNGGADWEEIGRYEEPNREYADIQVSSTDPLDVVRAVQDGAFNFYLERSVDGGTSWTRTNVPRSGFFCCLRRAPSDPSVLLYGTSSGLSRSTDHGATWTTVSVTGSYEVSSLAIDPTDADTFWVGSGQGLSVTTDGGASWARKNEGLEIRGLTDIAISPSSPNELMLATTGGELFLSRTGGDKWTMTPLDLVNNTIAKLPVISATDPNLYLLAVNPITGLLRSDNRGLTWRAGVRPTVTFGGSIEALDVDPFHSETFVVGIPGGELHRTTDGGENWTRVLEIFGTSFDISFAHDVEDRVYAGMGYGGVYLSTDGGATWQLEFDPGVDFVTVVEPAPSDSSHVYAVAGDSIYFHDPAVGAWQEATTNPARHALSLAVEWTDPETAYAGVDHPGTAGGTGGIYKTTDGGRNWTRIAGVLDGFDVVSIVTHPTRPGTVLVATRQGGAYRSEDGAATWEPLDRFASVAEQVNMNVVDPTNPFLLYAATEGYGVQVSINQGATYRPRVDGLTELYINALAFDPDTPSTLYAGSDAGIFVTADSATTWDPTALTAGEVSDLITHNEGSGKRIWATVLSEGVAFSEDGGASFDLFTSGLASLELTSIELEDTGAGKRIWATMHGGDGVAFSDDLGQSWVSAAGNGLTERNVNDLAVDPLAKRIWATTDNGVFFTDDSGLNWQDLSQGLPSETPVTSISLDPNSGEALVSLFSDEGGGTYRGGNIHGVWSEFNTGLDELKVRRLTNDNGHAIDASTAGTTFYAATAGDGVYSTELRTQLIDPPTITTDAIPGGVVRTSYTTTLAATGGLLPYGWSLQAGELPPGVTLNPATGEISGEPVETGLFIFTVQIGDANSRLDTKELTMRVAAEGPIFVDGFESGNTSAWSRTVGGGP